MTPAVPARDPKLGFGCRAIILPYLLVPPWAE